MRQHILALVLVASWAALLAACSSGTTDQPIVPGTTGSPPPTSVAPEPTTTPTADLDAWQQEANAICAQAIDSYQQKKAVTGDEALLAVAAAAAVRGAAQDLSALSSSTGDAERFSALADQYASRYQTWADAMEEGRIQDSITAFDAVDSAGTAFASKAHEVGADNCAEMVDSV